MIGNLIFFFDAVSWFFFGCCQAFDMTLRVLKETKNERMWFTIAMKLANLYMESKNYVNVQTLLVDLKRWVICNFVHQLCMHGCDGFGVGFFFVFFFRACTLPDGSDDFAKGSQLVEIYALEIQVCVAIDACF